VHLATGLNREHITVEFQVAGVGFNVDVRAQVLGHLVQLAGALQQLLGPSLQAVPRAPNTCHP